MLPTASIKFMAGRNVNEFEGVNFLVDVSDDRDVPLPAAQSMQFAIGHCN